jgi:hypothetical protein
LVKVIRCPACLDDLAEQYPATDAEALAPRMLDKRIPAIGLQQCFVEQPQLTPLTPEAPAIPSLAVFDGRDQAQQPEDADETEYHVLTSPLPAVRSAPGPARL